MWRYLIYTERFSIPMFGVMAVIGFLTGFYIVRREAKRLNIPLQNVESLAFWILVGVIIGGRVWYVLEMWNYYSKNVGEIFRFWEGGLVYYGGFIGGFIGGILYLKISRLNFSKTSDIIATGLPIALSFGRIGCFLNGCCFGKETDSFIGYLGMLL
jgi:phosphatidylglycerol:prolipoprotein diacylglycerol transferase